MSSLLITANQFDNIFIKDMPMMDVRAPIEFEKGAFTSSYNAPLMLDSEREKVGTCYKLKGQAAAIDLGHSLVNGKIKQARIDAWLALITANPSTYLYCFRGGLRSQLSQSWLKEAGVDIPYIQGGYKALRQHLIEKLEQPSPSKMLILSGITGSGKTDFLLKRTEAIDLEGAANHRGSSFGRNVSAQPSQINFENTVASELIKHQARKPSCLLLEDESFLIGRSAIPKPFYTQMQDAKMLVLEESEQDRLTRLLNAYVHKMYRDYVNLEGEEAGFIAFGGYLAQSITGIKKRLGGKQHDELQAMITNALAYQTQHNDTSAHLEWISTLLHKYYDPMYQYQLEKKHDSIIFRGDHQAMHQWLDEHQSVE